MYFASGATGLATSPPEPSPIHSARPPCLDEPGDTDLRSPPVRHGGATVEHGEIAVLDAIDAQIHPHRCEESIEQDRWYPIAIGGIDNRGQNGVGGGPAFAEVPGEGIQLLGSFGGAAARVEFVEDVVGSARESVQGVHGGALIRCEQSGRQEEGLSVARVELPAVPVGPVQLRVAEVLYVRSLEDALETLSELGRRHGTP